MVGFTVPSRSTVGYLDPDIAGEGQKVMIGEDSQMVYLAPVKPCIPDWSEIKSIKRYFQAKQHYEAFPAWLYHRNGDDRLFATPAEAQAVGVMFRETTPAEKARYGAVRVWDFPDDCEWRPAPWSLRAFDPRKDTHSKNVVIPPVDHAASQVELLRGLTLAIANKDVQKPAEVSDKDWQEFQQFLVFKKAQADVGAAAKEQGAAPSGDDVLGQLARDNGSHQHKNRR